MNDMDQFGLYQMNKKDEEIQIEEKCKNTHIKEKFLKSVL